MRIPMLYMLGISLVLAKGGAAQEGPNASPGGAKIVKLPTFDNETGAIPATTIYTPTEPGLFRASFFGQVIVTNAGNPTSAQGFFCPVVTFSDDSGATQNVMGLLANWGDVCLPIVGTLTNSTGSGTTVFRAQANVP